MAYIAHIGDCCRDAAFKEALFNNFLEAEAHNVSSRMFHTKPDTCDAPP